MEKLTVAHLPKIRYKSGERISPRDRLTLFVVMYRNTFCHATISDIACLSGMARSTVRRHVTNLVSAKYLVETADGYTAQMVPTYVYLDNSQQTDPMWKQIATDCLPISECGADLTANYVAQCLTHLDCTRQSTVGLGRMFGLSQQQISQILHAYGLVVEEVERNRKKIGARLQTKKAEKQVASVKVVELPEIEEEEEVDNSFLLSVQRKIAKSEKWLSDQGIEDVQAWLASPAAVWAVRCGQVSEYWICQQGVSAVECQDRFGFDAGCFTSKLDKLGKVG